MTIHEKSRFKQAFNRLAVAVRLPADQTDDDMQKIFWQGLEAFPIEAVEAGAEHLALTAQWFPKLAEWRDAASSAQNAQAIARALPPADRVWHSECATCDDTGFEILECNGTTLRACGRMKDHAPHAFAVPCACRPTNHTYQRKLAEARQRARGKDEAA